MIYQNYFLVSFCKLGTKSNAQIFFKKSEQKRLMPKLEQALLLRQHILKKLYVQLPFNLRAFLLA